MVVEKSSACETKILKQMELGEIYLQAQSPFENEIENLNRIVPEAKETFYLVEKKEKITGLTINKLVSNTEGFSEAAYTLTRADDEKSLDLNLAVEFKTIFHSSVLYIEQTFSIDSIGHCQLKLTSTTKQSVQEQKAGSYSFSELKIYSDGQISEKGENFAALTDAPLRHTIQLPFYLDKFYRFQPQLGVMLGTKKPSTKSKTHEFGLELELDIFHIDYTLNTNLVTTEIYGHDKVHKILFQEIFGNRRWVVPKAIWENLKLESIEKDSGTVKNELSVAYLKVNDSIQIDTTKKINYDHFEAYWKIKSDHFNTESNLHTLTLQEQQPAMVAGEVTEEDLVSNQTIQTKLPQIQSIAKSIAEETERPAQIQRILDYLDKYYSYDYEMLKNNVIRPLTTEEALSRGKGVCQHYAVIFTALARALKIPTRIVVGFHITDSVVRHAWNEVEISPGKWQVIEPQNPNSLRVMNTRFYFPLVRGAFLESKNDSYAELFQALTGRYSFKPLKIN